MRAKLMLGVGGLALLTACQSSMDGASGVSSARSLATVSVPAGTSRLSSPGSLATGAASPDARPYSPVASQPGTAAYGPYPSVVFAGRGVVIVATNPAWDGPLSYPSTLWSSTDLTHWRAITPPGSQRSVSPNDYASFDEASFISASIGWVTTWDDSALHVTFYRTFDGGKTWTVAPAGTEHGDHAGDADLIQLLTPTLAFSETFSPTGPGMNLSVSTDAGTSWRSVYSGPQATTSDVPSGPFEQPMVFVSASRGFAASGIPVFEFEAPGEVFTTRDGGAGWVRITPPAAAPCTAAAGPSECMFALPVFTDSDHGVLAGEVIDGTKASIGFDTTSDGGDTWRLASSINLDLAPSPANTRPNPALVVTPTTRTWLVVAQTPTGVVSRTSTDAGLHWTENSMTGVRGTPTTLNALDATDALLTTSVSIGVFGLPELYKTSDAGNTWQPVAFAQTPQAAAAPSTAATALGGSSPGGIAPVDSTLQPARPCYPESAPVVTITINPDTPEPDCVIVTNTQRLRVVNATNAFDQPGTAITINFAGLPPRTLERGEFTTYQMPFGTYLAPGQHYMQSSKYPGSNIVIWLK
jgi:photosystem II stability/assembly factor-like uncharacterized protein